MLKCPYCNTDNRDDARYCAYCSLPLSGTGYLVPGAVLQGRYHIARLVAYGGRGAVYQAHDNRLSDKSVALKEILESVLRDPQERADAIQQFRKEATLLATLTHDCLPRVSDFFEEKGRLYLVMDFIEGETLEHRLDHAAGPLPIQPAVEWGIQVCGVLHYLHTQPRPIIFRDLKPGNIMVSADNQIKLIDFGIAKIFDPAKKSDTISMGTPGYAPPEQYGSQTTTDPRADVYALGATLHHLLTQRDPAKEKLFSFADAPAYTFNPRMPRQLSDVIAKATEFERDNRYASAAEMRAALEECRPLLHAGKGAIKSGGSSGVTPRTVITALVLGGAVLAVIACLAIVVVFQNTGATTPLTSTATSFSLIPTDAEAPTQPLAPSPIDSIGDAPPDTATSEPPTDTPLPPPDTPTSAPPATRVPTRSPTATFTPVAPTPIPQAQLIVDSAVDFNLHVAVSGPSNLFFDLTRGQRVFSVPMGNYSVTISTDPCPTGATANIVVDSRGNIVFIDPMSNSCGYAVSWDH